MSAFGVIARPGRELLRDWEGEYELPELWAREPRPVL